MRTPCGDSPVSVPALPYSIETRLVPKVKGTCKALTGVRALAEERYRPKGKALLTQRKFPLHSDTLIRCLVLIGWKRLVPIGRYWQGIQADAFWSKSLQACVWGPILATVSCSVTEAV